MAEDSFKLKVQFRREFGHMNLARAVWQTLGHDASYFLWKVWHLWILREKLPTPLCLEFEDVRVEIPVLYQSERSLSEIIDEH